MTLAALKQRLNTYEKLMRLDKPIGILLLLWPTLWAIWLASDGNPNGAIVWIFALGTVLMRSAGCVINDYADREFDPHVARTRDRPLATKHIGTREALALAALLSLLAFLLIIPLNNLTKWMSIPAMLLAASYPYTKRFFAIPQAYLGIAFGFGIPMAYAAIQDTIPVIGWMLLLANVFWTIAYDTEYAMIDRADDLRIGIKTSAITFGRFDVAAILICYGIFLGIMLAIGYWQRLGWAYFSGLLIAGAMVFYQYRLIKDRIPEKCFRAFLDNTWIGGILFAGIAVDTLLRMPRF